MRYVIENPPFGTSWSGKDAKEGQEEAVKKEFEKAYKENKSRWGVALPSSSDSQLIFMQSAIDKLADNGRAAIISNGSPLFTGNTSSGESQIRRWMLEKDLIEAIIALPADLFYNTGIPTYVWIISKSKRQERIGKIQLIDATSICHKLRKNIGYKRNELNPEDRKKITELYSAFKENDHVKIFNNTEFIYREYSVMQPLQRNYSLSRERIQLMIDNGALSFLYDESKVYELEHPNFDSKIKENETKEEKEKRLEKESKKIKTNKAKLQKYYDNKLVYDQVINILYQNSSDKLFKNVSEFSLIVKKILSGLDKKIIDSVISGLSIMDKTAEIHRDKKGIIYDKETKDSEIIKWDENVDDYMKREVLPHVPDAKWFFEGKNEKATFEEDRNNKVIKIGAEIPLTRYFYKHKEIEKSSDLANRIVKLEELIQKDIKGLFE